MAISLNKLFIVLALLFFSKYAAAQSAYALYPQKRLNFHVDSIQVPMSKVFAPEKDNYVRNLAFFCRQEYKLEKVLKVPIRFRVGSLEHCNRLEGKSRY